MAQLISDVHLSQSIHITGQSI
uniref:Uncharacterized protein n=1 Tax=Anguilla anguilla TaxID=7936 RepID=A0A0E9VZL0_ANGAN